MNFLPIIGRELRLAVRVGRTYYSRSLAALVVAVISLGMLYAGFGGLISAFSAGKNLFIGLSLLAYVYVLIDGTFLTADCLSQEKREGTIGLLFLTDLKGYDVVLGKVVSRSLNSAYCLLAALPALGLGIFLGGVTGLDFFRMTLALLNGLLFSVSLGVLVSAICRHERRALSTAILGALTFGFLLPGAGLALQHFFKTTAIHPAFLVFSPAGAFLGALGIGATTLPLPSFSSAWFMTHALSWVFLALASVILPRHWQDRVARASFSFRRLWRNWRNHVEPESRGNAGRWLNVNPVLWFSERPGQKGLGIAAFLVLFTLVWIGGCFFYGTGWLELPVYFFTAFLLHLVLVYAVALQACRAGAEDRRSGVLELLLTTPLGAEMIVQGRLLAFKRQLLRPVLFILAVDLGLTAAGCWKIGFPSWEMLPWMALFVVLIMKFIADLYAFAWVGLWQGWKARTASRAIRQTVYNLILFRWMILLGLIAALGILTEGRAFRSPASALLGAIAYFALLAMTSLHFVGLAMSELKDDFRGLAAWEEEAARSQFIWWPFRASDELTRRAKALLRNPKLRVRSQALFERRT